MKFILSCCILSCLGAAGFSAPQWPGSGAGYGYGFAPWGGYGNYGSSSASASASASASSSSGSFQGYGRPGYGYGLPGYGQGYGNFGGGYQQQQFNQFQYNGYNNNYGSGNGFRYPFGYGK